MAIRVGRDSVQRILASPSSFALQVRQASDVGAAISALKLARVDLLGMATRAPADEVAGARPATSATVSPVVSAPGGPLILLERLRDDDLLHSVPEVVASRLEQAGVESATIEVPESGGILDDLDATPEAVVLRLFPIAVGAATVLPADWLDVAGEWVTGDLGDDDTVRMRVLTVESDVPAKQVAGVIHECGLARAWCDAVNGDLRDRIRTASLTYGRLPHLALAAGGPGVDTPGLVARYELLADIARELAADVAYACIDFEPTFEGLAFGLSPDGWQAEGGAPVNLVAARLLADRVPDAYPFQVLAPGHVARLGDATLPTVRLADGRVELELDDPDAWQTQQPERADARGQGWELLRPLLVGADEAEALAAAQPRPAMASSEPPAPDTDDGTVDIDSVVLEGAPHSRRGTRLTLLELAAWLAHEPHSDSPPSVSPVVATYARWLAAGFSHDQRQQLRAVAPRLVGTNDGDPAHERARSWAAAEWLVRAQAAPWLRAAGLVEAGERLASIGSLTDDLELVRAVELLSAAIAIASRRIEVTASVVDERGALAVDDQVLWEVWEEVTEGTGWVGASEAATFGAPAELVYATDLRVIECARDPRTRAELERTKQTIGDSAWAAALRAVADEAWEQGWRAADRAARELSGFTIRIEMGRVAKSALPRDDGDDLAEHALEVAERAARESLTKAALRGGTETAGEHPWDAACSAARSSQGGEAWAVVLDQARRTVGEDGWAQGMADARAAVAALLADAPDAVARVVVASVAREASGAAARSVAYRAAAIARSRGASDAAVAQAARDALAPVAHGLQRDAAALLDRLIALR